MPWLSTESYPLPEVDLVSFTFGNNAADYDDNKPVRILPRSGIRTDYSLRYITMLMMIVGHCPAVKVAA